MIMGHGQRWEVGIKLNRISLLISHVYANQRFATANPSPRKRADQTARDKGTEENEAKEEGELLFWKRALFPSRAWDTPHTRAAKVLRLMTKSE
jgi:hypothetical protein